MVSEKGFGADVELPHTRLQYRFAILRTFTAFAVQRKGRNGFEQDKLEFIKNPIVTEFIGLSRLTKREKCSMS